MTLKKNLPKENNTYIAGGKTMVGNELEDWKDGNFSETYFYW